MSSRAKDALRGGRGHRVRAHEFAVVRLLQTGRLPPGCHFGRRDSRTIALDTALGAFGAKAERSLGGEALPSYCMCADAAIILASHS
jgi:hypothetical protein